MMKKAIRIILIMIILATACSMRVEAKLLNLDSIAAMGKFPKFVIDTYRWGGDFFNGYDTTYVKQIPYDFNVKLRTQSWLDYYNFGLPDNMRMSMISEPSTSTGIWLTYLALTMGYDYNVSKIFGHDAKTRSRLSFSFTCSLFAFDTYYERLDGSTRINLFGKNGHEDNPDILFNGIDIHTWGLDTYYFFNHKKYSQAATFTLSRQQMRSQGSFFAGLSLYTQRYQFDFSSLPDDIKQAMPQDWVDYRYFAKNRTYALKVGYGYNWVINRHWVFGVSEAPTLGLRRGYLNNTVQKWSMGLSNRLQMSIVWNNKRWFMSAFGLADLNLLYDKNHTFTNAIITGSLSLGYRFNLW